MLTLHVRVDVPGLRPTLHVRARTARHVPNLTSDKKADWKDYAAEFVVSDAQKKWRKRQKRRIEKEKKKQALAMSI